MTYWLVNRSETAYCLVSDSHAFSVAAKCSTNRLVAAQLEASRLVTNQILFLLCTTAGRFGHLAQHLRLIGPEYFGSLAVPNVPWPLGPEAEGAMG